MFLVSFSVFLFLLIFLIFILPLALALSLSPNNNNRPGTVVFTLTASVIGMEVVVSERGLTLNSLQGIAPTVLQNAIGATMSLNDLIKTMRNAACDIFPDDDGFCYTENSCEKNHVMENHIYESISCFALSHNFAWSRWNIGSGSRTSVFLMRELIEHRKLVKQKKFCAVFSN